MIEPTTLTRDEWLALPSDHRSGVSSFCTRPITEHDFACHVHWLLDGSKLTLSTVEVATVAEREVMIAVGCDEPKLDFAAAYLLETEWDRELLPVNLRLSFKPRELVGVAMPPWSRA